jgi:hypothetical protein
MAHFIFVVDGEVAGELPVPNIQSEVIDKLIAILSSDPKIVVSDVPVAEGSLWNGTAFVNP